MWYYRWNWTPMFTVPLSIWSGKPNFSFLTPFSAKMANVSLIDMAYRWWWKELFQWECQFCEDIWWAIMTRLVFISKHNIWWALPLVVTVTASSTISAVWSCDQLYATILVVTFCMVSTSFPVTYGLVVGDTDLALSASLVLYTVGDLISAGKLSP